MLKPNKPKYVNSHALIIGINEYPGSPLEYAVNDAKAVAEALTTNCGFKQEQVTTLLDKQATKQNIHRAYMSFAGDRMSEEDRLLVFFAGHGETYSGVKGEIGYLIPCDGDTNDLSSLLKWTDLIGETDHFAAKHILFVLDACFSGLAIKRKPKQASTRFFRDMMQRRSIQVLTAGRANEPVADGGGPIANHSMFTGYLLKALYGDAIKDGYLSANQVCHYVLQNVAMDPKSNQSPHSGYVDGDGEFFFIHPTVADESTSTSMSEEMFITLSSNDTVNIPIIDQAKSLLSISEYRIKLYDLVAEETRKLINELLNEEFNTSTSWTDDEFLKRVGRYDEIMKRPCHLQMLLGFWGSNDNSDSITLMVRKVSESIKLASGNKGFNALRWYPVIKLVYACGLGAIAAKRYENLLDILHLEIPDTLREDELKPFLRALYDEWSLFKEMFQKFPGRERQFVPLNEYLFESMQPIADDVLFTGSTYGMLFDRLEVLIYLEYMSMHGGWGPAGRFGWKYYRDEMKNPFTDISQEIAKQNPNWIGVKAGFFKGLQSEAVAAVSKGKSFLEKLGWH